MFVLPLTLFLIFFVQTLGQRVKVVNFGAIPTEHISIHISSNIEGGPVFESQNPTAMDAATKQDLQDLTAIFTMFSLLDELSNQLFARENNGHKGFLGLEEAINEKPEKKKKKARETVFEKIIEDALKDEEDDDPEFKKRTDNFEEAHVEFVEGKTTINEQNQQKLIENIKSKEEGVEIVSGVDIEKGGNLKEETPKQENVKDEEKTVVTTKKKSIKEENINSNTRKVLLLFAAIIVALILYGLLKFKMSKLEKKEILEQNNEGDSTKVHQKKTHD